MANQPELESLYSEAQSALKAKDYDRASDLLRQILQIDENYKDTSRLLAQVVKLRRRRWYNHPLLWGVVGLTAVIGLGIWLAPKLQGVFAPQSIPPTASPTITLTPTQTEIPTGTPTLAPTPIPLTWRRVSIGQEFERDTVTVLVIDPKDPEVLYVGMKNAGIFKSIDGGLSWRPAHHGLSNTQVTSLLIDSQNPSILYAGTMGGIFKTEDGGENWVRIGVGIYVLMDPQDSSHLYKRDSDMIYETTDRGESWETVYTSQEGCPGEILGWGIHPVDGNTLFANGGEACEPGLYTSKDGGRNWALLVRDGDVEKLMERITVGIDGQGNLYFHWTGWGVEPIEHGTGRSGVFFPYPLPETIAFDTTGLVYFSCPPDNLCNFNLDENQKVSLGKPDVGIVISIAISPDDPDTLYAGGEGVSVSKDGGMTWANLDNGLGNGKLQLDTGTGNIPVLYIQPGGCDEFYAPGEGWDTRQSLYISTDGGSTWNFASQVGCHLIKDANGTTVYRIGESSWYTGIGQAVRGIIWRSQDGGRSWQRVLTPNHIQTIVAHINQTGRLYGFTHILYYQSLVNPNFQEEEYFYSEDYGHTWNKQEPPVSTKPCYGSTLQFIDKYRPMAIDPFDGNHVFVIDNGALLESHDSCDTTQTFATAPNTSMNSISFDPNNPETIYAGTDSGAYISFDGGQTWGQVNDGLLGATVVYSIIVDKDGNVYAATPYGIFKLEGK